MPYIFENLEKELKESLLLYSFSQVSDGAGGDLCALDL